MNAYAPNPYLFEESAPSQRDPSADILCIVSSLLLPVTSVPYDHGRFEASSQRLNATDVLDVCLSEHKTKKTLDASVPQRCSGSKPDMVIWK